MREIIALRHGKDNGSLTDIGKEQMQRAGERIKAIVGERSVYIVSSEKKRAIESAAIIMGILGINGQNEQLGDTKLEMNTFYDEVFRALENRKEEVGVVVGHKPFVENLPSFFKRNRGFEVQGLRDEIDNGLGYHIDRATRIVKYFFE